MARWAMWPVYRGFCGPSRTSANLRVQAIGTDRPDRLPPARRPRKKGGRSTPVLEVPQLLAERDRAALECRVQHRMQIAAVHVDIGRTVMRFARRIERKLEQNFARVPFAADERFRMQADVGQRLLDPETAHHQHHVGAQMDSSTDAREGGSLLVHFHREPGRCSRPATVIPPSPAPMTAISAVRLILVVPNLQRHDPVAPKVGVRNMSYDGPQNER